MQAKAGFQQTLPAPFRGNVLGQLAGNEPLFFDSALTMSDALYVKGLIDTRGENDFIVSNRVNNILREMRESNKPIMQPPDLALFGIDCPKSFAAPAVFKVPKRKVKKKSKPVAKKRKKRR